MMRKVLLDTNLLIAALDEQGNTSDEVKISARKQLRQLLQDPQVLLFITPLIRYEALRGINWKSQDNFEKMKQTLDELPELEITREITELSANLFRFDSWQAQQAANKTRNMDKRRFDIFHFCSAQCNGLELLSHDRDLDKIKALYEDFNKENSNCVD